MKVLVACEFSGVVRDAFIKEGHEAMSCDLLPTESDGPHYQGDVFDIIGQGWDLMIAHPPCTYLCVTGNKWMKPEYADRFPGRQQARKDALAFFIRLYEADIPKVCVENPVGVVSSMYRKPDQYVQPWQFGDNQSKKTGLWLRGLPKLVSTNVVEPVFWIQKNGSKDPMWHKESMKMSPLERMKYRSKTFPGIAKAMAQQWGGRNNV